MSHDLSHHTTLPSFTSATGHPVAVASGTTHATRPNASSASEPLLETTPNSKKRRSSKMKSGKQLSRSASTPQIRDGIMSESEIDKKRNKLGYQRISIACAHCRRRKIRCLVAEGDPHSRCQNCIRLKKECVFYPVDQQTAMENNSEVSSKPGVSSGPSSTVSQSPPNNGSDFEQTRDFASFPSLPSNAPGAYQGLPVEPGSALPMHGVPRGFAPPEYTYQMQSETRPTWHASEATTNHHPPNMTDGEVTASQSLWRYGHPVSSGDFAPFPTDPSQVSQSPQMVHPFAFTQQRNGSLWPQPQQPARSLSYGAIEAPPGQSSYGTTYLAQPTPVRYPPPSLDVQHTTMMLQEPGPHSAPVRTQHPSFGQTHPYMFQQDHGNTSTTFSSSHQAYSGGWYSDPSAFGTLEEEPESYGSRQQRPG